MSLSSLSHVEVFSTKEEGAQSHPVTNNACFPAIGTTVHLMDQSVPFGPAIKQGNQYLSFPSSLLVPLYDTIAFICSIPDIRTKAELSTFHTFVVGLQKLAQSCSE